MDQSKELSKGEKKDILKLQKEATSIRFIAQGLGITNTTRWNVLKQKETTRVLTLTDQPRKIATDDSNIARAVKKYRDVPRKFWNQY